MIRKRAQLDIGASHGFSRYFHASRSHQRGSWVRFDFAQEPLVTVLYDLHAYEHDLA
jgi:hypothetical protein